MLVLWLLYIAASRACSHAPTGRRRATECSSAGKTGQEEHRLRKDQAAASLAFLFGLLLFISGSALAQEAQNPPASEEGVACDQYVCDELEEEQDPALDLSTDPPEDDGEMPVGSASPEVTQRGSPEESPVNYGPAEDVAALGVAADVAPKEEEAVVDAAAATQPTETAMCEQYGCGGDGDGSEGDDGSDDNETGLSCGPNDKFVGTDIYCRPHHISGDANGGPIDFTPCGEDDCGMKGVPSYMVCHRRSSTTTESGGKFTYYPGFVECENVNEYGNEAPHELCFLSFYLHGREALRVWCDDGGAGGPDGAAMGLDDAREAVDAVKRSRKDDDTGGVDLINFLTPGDDSADGYRFSVGAFLAALGLAPGTDGSRSAGGGATEGIDPASGGMVAENAGSGGEDPKELVGPEERGASGETGTVGQDSSGVADTDREQSAAPEDQAAEELVEAAESIGVGSVANAAPLGAADIVGSGGDEAMAETAVSRRWAGEAHVTRDEAALVPEMVAEVTDVTLRTIRGQAGGSPLALSGFLLLLAGCVVSRGILRH